MAGDGAHGSLSCCPAPWRSGVDVADGAGDNGWQSLRERNRADAVAGVNDADAGGCADADGWPFAVADCAANDAH